VGLPLAAVLLLGWSLTTLVGDVRWGPLSVLPVALAYLSPFVTVAAIPVVAICLRGRRWLPLVPAVAAAGLPWVFVLGYASPATLPPGGTLPLRAMIVTAHDGAANADDIVSAVRGERADLLVVTELSDRLAHDLTQAGLSGILTPRWVDVPAGGPPTAGIGLYSRFPVDQIRALPGTHWPAVTARVSVAGRTLSLVAGHAAQPSVDHLDQWSDDLNAFGSASSMQGPVLVLANLYATPWHSQFRRLVSGRLHDAGELLGHGLRPTWPAWGLSLLPTDHALVAGMGVDSLDTTVISGSDHKALTVGLQVPAD
jgi:endonuclease/exonuclease/phosphatase (EEP) superfamily protein YafD